MKFVDDDDDDDDDLFGSLEVEFQSSSLLHRINIICIGSANRTLLISYNFICWYTGHVLCIDCRPRPLNFFV